MESSPKRRKLDHAGAISTSVDVGVHRQNTFLLEAQELLKEVGSVDYSGDSDQFPGAENVLKRIKKAVENVGRHEAEPIADVTARFQKTHKIAIPFPHPKPSTSRSANYKLSLLPPARVNVVGSYILRTMLKGQAHGNKDDSCAIDMVVVMDKEMFQEKDFRDLRYFYKRAYFLSHVAVAVQKEMGQEATFEFEGLGENGLVPVLVTRFAPKGDGKAGQGRKAEVAKEYTIHIIPCAPDDLFPKKKLSPTSNNVRPPQGLRGEWEEELPPTPFYNSTLLAEMSYMPYLRLQHHASQQCPAFKDACILGRIWLRQRGIGSRISQGGFGHFEFAAITALLLNPGNGKNGQAALSSSLGATQIFRAVLRLLAVTDFVSKPLIFGSVKNPPEIVTQGEPAIYDLGRGHNLAYKMSHWSSTLVRQHAKWCLSLFADDAAGQFGPLFITRVDMPQIMYDLRFTICDGSLEAPDNFDFKGGALNTLDQVHTTLHKALGDRARLIHLSHTGIKSWRLISHTPSPILRGLKVGILFDAANMGRKMDRGPDAEDKANAAKYRKFWGERAELRRFQDGSMTENVMWMGTTPFEICEEIVRYILKLHFRVGRKDIKFFGKHLPDLINLSAGDTQAFIATRKQFEEFERDIRGLKDLPLHVRHVYPTSPELRYTSLALPPSSYNRNTARALDVVLSFEQSGKWPENVAAIQRTKVAFLQRIGYLLEESKGSCVKARLGLEEEEAGRNKGYKNQAFLDVTYGSTLTFRLRIHSTQEETLLEHRTKDRLLETVLKKEASELLSISKREGVMLPLHTQAIGRFCTFFPALGPTTRLLKRWFSAQRLSNHFPAELVELFSAKVFFEPYPWSAPSSAGVGFLRALQFLSRWDWRDEPLVIDFSGRGDDDDEDAGGLDVSEREEVDKRMKAWRRIDPNMNRVALFVATNIEKSGIGYTSNVASGPNKVVAARMTALARSACKLIRATHGFDDVDTAALFTPNLFEFDFVVHLSPVALESVITGNEGANGSELRHILQQEQADLDGTAAAAAAAAARPVPKRPARLVLETLTRLYGDAVLLFQGEAEEDEQLILGVWNQQVRARTFRVNLPCSFMPVGGSESNEVNDDATSTWVDGDDSDLVEVNRKGILAEIARIGGEVVEKIEVVQGH